MRNIGSDIGKLEHPITFIYNCCGRNWIFCYKTFLRSKCLKIGILKKSQLSCTESHGNVLFLESNLQFKKYIFFLAKVGRPESQFAVAPRRVLIHIFLTPAMFAPSLGVLPFLAVATVVLATAAAAATETTATTDERKRWEVMQLRSNVSNSMSKVQV